MSHPFGTLGIVIADILRIVCVIVYLIIVCMCINLAVNKEDRAYMPATVWGLSAIVILGASVACTEIQRIGHTAFEGGYFWRLPVNLAGMFVSFKTVLVVRKYPQKEPRHKPWG